MIAVDWFPPAFKAGGPIRSTYNLAAFLSITHDVWVVTGDRDLDDEPLREIKTNEWSRVVAGEGVIQVRYSSIVSRSLWLDILNEIQPAVVHLNSLFSRRFTLLPLGAMKHQPNICVVVAPRGMLGAAALSVKPVKKRLFLALVRSTGWMDRVRWHASSEQEAREVRLTFPRAQVAIAQNLSSPAPPENPLRNSGSWKVVVIGRIHRMKNLHFGLKAVLEAEGSRPIKVDFIGPVEDPAYQKELVNLAVRNPSVNVVFHGGIPHSELGQYFHAAHYLLSPTTQENFGHSIVEAWAHGCPVIISDRTPWRGIAAHNVGWDWPLEEKKWKEGLSVALTLEHEEWEAMSSAAREYFFDRVQNVEAERANLALLDE